MRAPLCLLFLAFGLTAQTLTIRNVAVVDSGGIRNGQTVIISGGRITSVGPSSKNSGAGAIDGTGKFLIPGLWDMHVHMWESSLMQNLYVAAGVLGVRDMGSDLARTKQLRTDIAAGRVIGPRIFTSGPMLDGAGAAKHSPVLECPTPESARQAVDTVEKGSADFVKVLSGLTPDAYRAAAQRARVIRMPFVGHVPEGVSIQEAIDARQRSIEHMYGVPLSCTPLEPTLRQQRAEAVSKNDTRRIEEVRERTYATFSPGLANQLFHDMARYDVWQTPTLSMWQRRNQQGSADRTAAPELQYVPEAVRKSWQDARNEPDARSATELTKEYEFYARLAKLAWGSGAGMLAGSDTGDPYVIPGFALHDELEALVAAGIPTADVLAMAASGPAKYFGLESTYGSIAKGKTADLVLLNANPLTDIRNTRGISAVVWQGRLLNRKCLDSLQAGKQEGCPAGAGRPAAAAPSAAKPKGAKPKGAQPKGAQPKGKTRAVPHSRS